MNSEQALQEVLQTFCEVETAGPIYRGDNQEIFQRLGQSARKKFEAARHKLSKMALGGNLEDQKILQFFKQINTHILRTHNKH